MVQADYLLPSLEDIHTLYGHELTAVEAGLLLKRLGCRSVIMKAGKQGAYLCNGESPSHIPCTHDAPPVDLMGAGDAFVGGFIAGLLEDMDCQAAARLGNQVAGYSVRLPGNIESLPNQHEVRGFADPRHHVFR